MVLMKSFELYRLASRRRERGRGCARRYAEIAGNTVAINYSYQNSIKRCNMSPCATRNVTVKRSFSLSPPPLFRFCDMYDDIYDEIAFPLRPVDDRSRLSMVSLTPRRAPLCNNVIRNERIRRAIMSFRFS